MCLNVYMQLGEVSYHDYKGDLYDEDIDEWEEIGQDLGPHNRVHTYAHMLKSCS